MSAAGASAATAAAAAAVAAAAATACGPAAIRGRRKTARSPGEAQPCSLFGFLTAFFPGEAHRPRLEFTPGVESPRMA